MLVWRLGLDCLVLVALSSCQTSLHNHCKTERSLKTLWNGSTVIRKSERTAAEGTNLRLEAVFMSAIPQSVATIFAKKF